MPRDLFAEASGPKDLFAGSPEPAQAARPDFAKAFEAYRNGEMPEDKRQDFEELLKRKMPRMFHDQPMQEMKSGSEVVQTAATNLPGSLVEEGKNLWSAISHPMDTIEGVTKLGSGALAKMSPDNETQTLQDEQNIQMFDEVVDSFKEQYGTKEGFLQAVQEKPAAVLMDLAGLITGGGTLMSKVPGLQKLGGALTEVGGALDPIQIAGQAAKAAAAPVVKGVTALTEEGLGITTGVGGGTIKEAKGHGRDIFTDIEGSIKGEPKKDVGFRQAQRGELSSSAIASRAKTAVKDVAEQRRQAFLENLEKLEGQDTALDMDLVNEAFADGIQDLKVRITDQGEFNLDRVSPKSGDRGTLKSVIDRVMEHGGEAGDMSPSGMLELRKYLDRVNSKSPEISGFVDNLKGAIDETLSELPGYKKLREQEDLYGGLLDEFQTTLGIGDTKKAHEVVRKLVSVGQEDIGLRRDLLKQLEAMTDTSLAQEIAGLEMQPVMPSAMTRRASGGGTINVIGGGLRILGALALIASPRAVGTILHWYGYKRNTIRKVIKALKDQGAFDQKVTTGGAIAGRVNEEEDK